MAARGLLNAAIKRGSILYEQLYTQLIQHSAQGILQCSAQGRVDQANPAACRLFAVSVDDLQGMPLMTLLAGAVSDVQQDDLQDYLKRLITIDVNTNIDVNTKFTSWCGRLELLQQGVQVHLVPVRSSNELQILALLSPEGLEANTQTPTQPSPQADQVVTDQLAESTLITSDIFVMAVDCDWQVTHVNDIASAVLGLTKGKAVAASLFEVLPQLNVPGNIFTQGYRQAMATGHPILIEGRPLDDRFAGQWHNVYAIPNENGLTIYAYDITARKQSELALDQGHHETLQLLNSSGDSVIALNRNWQIVYANEDVTCWYPEGFIGRNYWDVFPHPPDSVYRQTYEEVLNTGKPIRFEARSFRRGTWREYRVFPSLEGIVIYAADIGVLKDAQESLEHALQEKEDILNSITDSVLVIDRNWNFVYANDNALHAQSQGLVGRNYWEVYPDNQESIFVRHYQQVMDTRQPVRFVAKMSKSGIWGEVRVFPSPEGIAVYIANIDELKRKEDALENALAAKEMLLKEVHHRTKNNMQLISSMLSIQAHTLTDDASRKAILESRDRINVLADVHKLMYQQLEAETINAHSHLSALIHKLSRSMGRSNLNVDLNIDAIDLTIQQAIPLGLIVNELMTNIFKHAFVNPSSNDGISLAMYLEDGQIVLELHDNGVGLPVGFDPHQDSLGMTIIQALTGQLAGTLTMHNQHAGGVLTKLSFLQENLPERP
ncbi:MAG: PAS domain-containing protein [Deinococcota bacterium]